MKTATIRGKQLHYHDIGEGFPIVFSHSYLWDSHMWDPQLKELSKSYRCIAVDMWAHGASDPMPEGPVNNKQIADDYWELTQQLGLEEFAFIGLSVGGMIGTHLALDHPEAVKALAICGSYVGAEPEESRQEYFTLLDTIVAAGHINSLMADMLAPYFFSPKTLTSKPELPKNFKQDLEAIYEEKVSSVVEIGKGIFTRPNLLEDLHKLDIPTLVLVGEDDGPRPPSESKEMADRLPNTHLAIIPDAGHISSVEQPELVTKELHSLMERCKAHHNHKAA